MAYNKPPIKINTSMTTMAMTPNHNINPLSPGSVSIIKPKTDQSVSPKTPYYPNSPISPCSSPSPGPQHSPKSTIQYEMKKRKYIPYKSIASTLQGSVWKAKKFDKKVVVKVTRKELHSKNIAIVNGTEVSIKEDIIKETAILRYLSSNNPPPGLVKFESFFSDKDNFFLVMEDGGTGFFEFVQKCHQFINANQLSIKEWLRFCKMAFRQIVALLDWLHNDMRCCHLDVSLENFVISDVMVMVDHDDRQIRFTDNFVIRIIDFGLAEVFTSKNKFGKISFACTKYVGKSSYKSPAVYNKKKVFDARAADVWSLGVVLFMMCIGGSPYQRPSKSDIGFTYIINGKFIKLLKTWKRTKFVTPLILDLMGRIFTPQKYRLNIDEIKKHPWLL